MNSEERFFVDGKYLTAEECRTAFRPGPLADRQQKCLRMIEGHRVLDVGCYGGGFIAKAVQTYPDKTILGVDHDEENIKIARFLFPRLKDHFQTMNVYRLAFEDESFDCVLLQEVIEHLNEPHAAVREIARVLKKSGYLIVSTINPYYWKDILSFAAFEGRNRLKTDPARRKKLRPLVYFKNVEWNRHLYGWTPALLLTLLAANGFEYMEHSFGGESRRAMERLVLRAFPYFGPTQIMKVRKMDSGKK